MKLEPLDRKTIPEYEVIFSAMEDTLGFVPNSILTMARDPELLIGFSLLSKRVMNVKKVGSITGMIKLVWKMLKIQIREARSKNANVDRIDDGLRHLISLAVSYSAGCRYCQAHTSKTASIHGICDQKINALFNYEASEFYTAAERAALDLAFAAGEVPNNTGPEHFTKLRAFFSEAQILDIVSVIAFFGFLNRWNDTMGTALEAPAMNYAEAKLGERWAIGKHA